MLGGESNKLHKPGTAIPLRDLPANLETRVKNKDRASPNMSTLEVTMIRLGLGEYFQRRQSSNAIRNLVEQPDSMLNSKRPEMNVV